jgi:hypothetical protein
MKIRSNNSSFWCKDEATFIRLSVFMEKEGWPATYAEWVKNAENYTTAFKKKGVIFTKIEADPDEFFAWCRVKACKADSRARSLYAAEKFINIPKSNN